MSKPTKPPFQGVLEAYRLSPRRLNEVLLRRQVRRLRDRAVPPAAARAGWECRCRATCESDRAGFRYTLRLALTRASRAVLRMILLREIQARAGKDAWIEPALDLCTQEGTDDPRRAIALLDGGDRLLTGDYQADWLAVRRSVAAEHDGPVNVVNDNNAT